MGPQTLAVMPQTLYVASAPPLLASPSRLLAKTETRDRPRGQALIPDERCPLESLRDMCNVASNLTQVHTLIGATIPVPRWWTCLSLLPTRILKPESYLLI